MRIVSLLPSLTEICFSLGLGNQLVAITHECDFPSKTREIPHITRSILPEDLTDSAEIDRQVAEAIREGRALYELDRERLASLRPDLILTQDLCRVCAVSIDEVRAIAKTLDPVPEVVSIEPNTLDEIIDSIQIVGDLTGRSVTAEAVVDALKNRVSLIREQVGRTEHRRRVVCLEWLDPPMVAGHWVPEMVEIAGGVDPLGKPGAPSFKVSWGDIVQAAPDTIVLMPCGYGLPATVTEAVRLVESGNCIPSEAETVPAIREGHVYAVDGSAYFSRPGPRVVSGIELLAGVLHAELAASHTPPGSVEPVHLLPAGVQG
jgi:iron complex transport system substrate-binding protein